jgi:isoaspartyl peptidase/L-asparaginase-like protein (Ntn-hydrolase superfamily)
MKTLGSFLVVELMRNGFKPEQACREALMRIRNKISLKPEHQVGFIALSKTGETGAFGLRSGFSYAVMMNGKSQLLNAAHLL